MPKHQFPYKRFGNLKRFNEATVCYRCKCDIRAGTVRYYDNGINAKAIRLGPVCTDCRKILEPGWLPGEDPRDDAEVIIAEISELSDEIGVAFAKFAYDLGLTDGELLRSMSELRTTFGKLLEATEENLGTIIDNQSKIELKLDRLLSRSARSAWEIENKV